MSAVTNSLDPYERRARFYAILLVLALGVPAEAVVEVTDFGLFRQGMGTILE